MKKYVICFFLVAASLTGLSRCSQPTTDASIDHYTCPMHHQIHMDKPGNCPICGMKLVPVYKEGMGPGSNMQSDNTMGMSTAMPDRDHEVSGKSVMIAANGQAIADIKTSVVIKRDASKTIRTFGRVAFDPDLAVAQTDYLVAMSTSPELKAAGRRRLKLLGMSEYEIKDLEKKRQASSNLYLPDNSVPMWVYATLYEDDVPLVKPGVAAEITVPSLANQVMDGVVMAVDPVVDSMTHTLRARIELKKPDAQLKLGTSVDVVLKIPLGMQLTVPKSALIDTGLRRIAYVVRDGTRFTPVNVVTGGGIDNGKDSFERGGEVTVLKGLIEGDVVATGALFLVDSEAQLRGSE